VVGLPLRAADATLTKGIEPDYRFCLCDMAAMVGHVISHHSFS